LCDEMGLYDSDPLGRLGMLQGPRFFPRGTLRWSIPGLHVKGWSRERAIEYMVATHRRQTRPPWTTEVERYCTWPGQACSYKVGHTRWLKLRAQAQRPSGREVSTCATSTTWGSRLRRCRWRVLERVIDEWLKSRAA